MTAIEEARAALAEPFDERYPSRQAFVFRDRLRALIAEVERLSVPPSDDEREALRDELAGWVIGAGYYQSMVGTSDAVEMADAILAAGFRRQGPITDEMVERAWIAYRDELGPEERVRMRAALEAALNPPTGQEGDRG